MEQNQALGAVDLFFFGLPHRPQKKSLKPTDTGRGIELSFTTPALGRRYEDRLGELEAMTGWKIWIGPAVNQQELMQAAGALCRANDIQVKKTSYIPERVLMRVQTLTEVPSTLLEEMARQFTENTGADLEIVRA